jgi:hypothetical protein
MIREIKFRAWDVNKKKMRTDIVYACHRFYYDLHDFDKQVSIPSDHYVMQFTGLLDRLGKEIYEGDICRFDVREGGVGEPAYHNLVGQVGFSFGCYTIGDFLSHYHSLEVIGNIYENPNLLEGKDG